MQRAKTFPKGTIYGKYFVVTYKQGSQDRYAIRRRVTLPDGTVREPRHPFTAYSHLKTRQDFDDYVNRLNHRDAREEERRLAIELKLSFIPPVYMEGFRDRLRSDIPSDKDFHYQFNTVFKKYFLLYFVDVLNVCDPKEWAQHQETWGAALLGKASGHPSVFGDVKMSVKTIKRTIQIANRFMAFMHLKNPAEYPAVEFDPLGTGALKAYEAELRLGQESDGELGRYIPPEEWTKIDKKLPADIAPFIRLMYHYGLRRGESLGFDNTDYVKVDYLKITQQLKNLPKGEPRYAPLKDKESRQTPHWFCTPQLAYSFIRAGLEYKIHPDTLYNKWLKFTEDNGFNWELHDFRRTFITRALREKNPRDVQLAVGHVSLSTTMRYAQDDRQLGDAVFIPDEDAG